MIIRKKAVNNEVKIDYVLCELSLKTGFHLEVTSDKYEMNFSLIFSER